MKYLPVLVLLSFIFSCEPAEHNKNQTESPTWISLFNGKDLDGWTPKITGFELGENYGNTFRVVDSCIQVNYDQYERFEAKYGHLFYKVPYGKYHLKLQYRFIGEQASGGEGWAFKNSGVMFHCQDPQSMGVEQEFPVSLEAQFLGGNGSDSRPTANLCTPGLHVTIGDTLVTDHCISADAPTFHGEEWVSFEMYVYNDSLIQHVVNGKTVISYSNPIIGGGHLPENYFLPDGTAIKEGYIALQSESHPIEFKDIFLRELK